MGLSLAQSKSSSSSIQNLRSLNQNLALDHMKSGLRSIEVWPSLNQNLSLAQSKSGLPLHEIWLSHNRHLSSRDRNMVLAQSGFGHPSTPFQPSTSRQSGTPLDATTLQLMFTSRYIRQKQLLVKKNNDLSKDFTGRVCNNDL